MQGNILTFSTETNTGIITGEGNKRYTFNADDWKEKCPVISRVNVDFVAIEDRATEIYCTDSDALKDGLEKLAAQKAAEIELAESIKQKEIINKLERTYSGFYTSNDQALWKGVCAGLAHKTGIPVIIVRALTVYPGIFLFPLYFIFWKKWKCLETKNIYSVGADKFSEKINSAANVFNTLAGGKEGIAKSFEKSKRDAELRQSAGVSVLPCAKCGTMCSASPTEPGFNCPVCKAYTWVHRRNDGTVSSTH